MVDSNRGRQRAEGHDGDGDGDGDVMCEKSGVCQMEM